MPFLDMHCVLSVTWGVLAKAASSSVLKLICVVIVPFPPEVVFLLAFFLGQKHLDISSPPQGCCECLMQVWLGLPDIPLPDALASSVGCASLCENHCFKSTPWGQRIQGTLVLLSAALRAGDILEHWRRR